MEIPLAKWLGEGHAGAGIAVDVPEGGQIASWGATDPRAPQIRER